jgi:hypothetical protein
MKNKRLLAALGALVLLIATVVYGDYNVLSKGSYYQNATNGARTDVSGHATVVEQSPPALYYAYFPAVISGVFASVQDAQSVSALNQNRDSSSVIDCRGYNRAALYLFATGASAANSDSLVAAEFALSVRGHIAFAQDSMSTFRTVQRTIRTSGSTSRDTVGGIADGAYYSSGNSDSLFKTPMPDETVIIDGALFAGVSTKQANRGMIVWSTRLGEDASMVLPFMSFRLRHTKQYYNSTGTPTAMPSGTVAKVNVRCDLVLWRD